MPRGRGRAVSVTCQCIFFVEWEIHVQVAPLDRPLPPGEGWGEGLATTSASSISSQPLSGGIPGPSRVDLASSRVDLASSRMSKIDSGGGFRHSRVVPRHSRGSKRSSRGCKIDSRGCNGYSRGCSGCSRMSTDVRECPRILANVHGSSRMSTDPRGCPRMFADVHGSSRMSGDLRECQLRKLIGVERLVTRRCERSERLAINRRTGPPRAARTERALVPASADYHRTIVIRTHADRLEPKRLTGRRRLAAAALPNGESKVWPPQTSAKRLMPATSTAVR